MANFYNPYYQNYYPQLQQPLIQNGGVVNVQSEQEARYYPVAPATTVIFDNAKDACIYKKTVGNSTDAPKFDVYKRVEPEVTEAAIPIKEYAEKKEIEALRADIKTLNERINSYAKSNAVNANDATTEK